MLFFPEVRDIFANGLQDDFSGERHVLKMRLYAV